MTALNLRRPAPALPTNTHNHFHFFSCNQPRKDEATHRRRPCPGHRLGRFWPAGKFFSLFARRCSTIVLLRPLIRFVEGVCGLGEVIPSIAPLCRHFVYNLRIRHCSYHSICKPRHSFRLHVTSCVACDGRKIKSSTRVSSLITIWVIYCMTPHLLMDNSTFIASLPLPLFKLHKY